MNTGSKIDISQSSLLSLKAELARKHEEANRSKAQAQGNYIKPLAKPAKNSVFTKTNAGLENRLQNDVEELTEDEGAKLNKSRAALEAKSKIYDSLMQQSPSDSNYLVDFSQKARDEVRDREAEEEAEERRRREKEEEEEEARRAESDEYDAPSDPEDDWVEYTDSLGRTRRCLRRDLSRFRELDDRFRESLTPKEPIEMENSSYPGPLPPGGLPPGCTAPDLMSEDMRREMQRQKWEEQEEKLQNKPDVHYQDVLFDEARMHGVGYFPFAKEESARRTQQDDLKKLRADTQRHQTAAQAQRQIRQQRLQARLRAAHNRKRAREGLPPLADDEELPGQKEEEPAREEPAPDPAPVVQRATGPRLRPSPAVRPWDIGKEGVPTPVLTQEEWVDKKRIERKKEFAPPSFYEDRVGDQPAGKRGGRPREYNCEDKPPGPASGSAGFGRRKFEEPQGVPETQGGLFFTSKRQKNARREEVRMPMEEEEDFSEEQKEIEVETMTATRSIRKDIGAPRRVGAEIAPPPTFDYFGPSEAAATASRRASNVPAGGGTSQELSNAISAGLQYLRRQAEERESKKEKGLFDIV